MDSALKIVIVDESPVRAAILKDGLSEAGIAQVLHIEATTNLLARIYEIDPDVILIDLENPSRDVLEALSSGAGPKRLLVTLGYSGWAAGQLEEEIGRNGWLTVDAARYGYRVDLATLRHRFPLSIKGVTLAHLKGTLEHLTKRLFGADRELEPGRPRRAGPRSSPAPASPAPRG